MVNSVAETTVHYQLHVPWLNYLCPSFNLESVLLMHE